MATTLEHACVHGHLLCYLYARTWSFRRAQSGSLYVGGNIFRHPVAEFVLSPRTSRCWVLCAPTTVGFVYSSCIHTHVKVKAQATYRYMDALHMLLHCL